MGDRKRRKLAGGFIPLLSLAVESARDGQHQHSRRVLSDVARELDRIPWLTDNHPLTVLAFATIEACAISARYAAVTT